ncbi:MAG: GGDEF domain-containing response regulator [Candidatus Omnitrophica bacterium]|nr:GGDEF domain-containing response regulator [Candidatus Omnitrophota bacterium]
MSGQRIRVLVVEDDANYANLLTAALSGETARIFQVEWVETLQAGLAHLANSSTDVVLLDLFLPGSNGLDTFERVRMHAPEVPIVVLTVLDDDAVALEAVRQGAQDYLVKGQVPAERLSRVIGYAIERHRMQTTLQGLSLVDELTRLYNRRGFLNLAAQHLKLAQRTKRGLSLAFIDLDGLKHINDTFGHHEGDRALVETAEILKRTFRSSDIMARIGGDEFAILAIEAQEDSGGRLASRLQDKVREHNAQQQRSHELSLSMGIAHLDPQNPSSVEGLMTRADQALYEHKRSKQKV